MEIEIDSKVNNALLNRIEVYFTIKHTGEGTPNREIIRGELAEKLNVKKENIIVNTIKSSFGYNISSGYAKIYSSVEKSRKIESDYILIKNKIIRKLKKSEKKEDTTTLPEKEKINLENVPKEKTIEKKPDTQVETKDELKDKKERSEKISSDILAEEKKGETHIKELKPDQKVKDESMKEE